MPKSIFVVYSNIDIVLNNPYFDELGRICGYCPKTKSIEKFESKTEFYPNYSIAELVKIISYKTREKTKVAIDFTENLVIVDDKKYKCSDIEEALADAYFSV